MQYRYIKLPFSFMPTLHLMGQNKKYEKQFVRVRQEREPWEYKNGKQSVCDPLKMSFTVYRDVKRDSCSVSTDISILS